MNAYEVVTNQIIALLEQGQIPWHKPWTGGSSAAISYHTGKPYSLLNQLLLAKPGEYISFLDCKKAGGHVKKGAKAKTVFLWKPRATEKRDADGQIVLDAEGKPVMISKPLLMSHQVFHLTDDCEGVELKHTAGALPAVPAEPIAEAEKILAEYVAREGITLQADRISGQAYYAPSLDLINLPCLLQFENAAEYYSTAFHEATHSTGHPSRLNRFKADGQNAAFGSEIYSKEELTAEIGAACVLHSLGIETGGTVKNSAAYIQNWLQVLKNDKQLIVGAAARAEKAVRLILNQADETTGAAS